MTDYPQGYSPSPSPHCGVLAVAICSGKSFEEAWDVIARMHKRPGAWKGRTYLEHRQKALVAFSVNHKNVTLRKRCQVKTFSKRLAKPGVSYMLTVGGHVLTLRDGILIDQHKRAPVEDHSSSRQLVKHYIEITGENA